LRRLFVLGVGLWALGAAAFWLDPRPLDVPVQGIARARVRSSFGFPRDGGRRRHQGADLFAARGTPVVAAASGVVVARGTTPIGGRVVYTFGRRGVLCYYAHLDRWNEDVGIGDMVGEGDVLGYVGDTGNARGTRPHLHFETRPLALALVAVDPVSLLR
jgi:murein DD-endopeptidase MepM/ murein hydrolase activator NlpD